MYYTYILRCEDNSLYTGITTDLKRRFDEWLSKHHSPTTIREGYGLTECCAASCFTPLNYYRPGSIGIPYADTIYRIVEYEQTVQMIFNI